MKKLSIAISLLIPTIVLLVLFSQLTPAYSGSAAAISIDDQDLPNGIQPFSTNADVDLLLTKNSNPNPVFVGQTLTYTLVVSNLSSPITATNVIITDTLPTTVTLVSASPGCSGTPLVCSLGSVTNTASITITVIPNQAGILNNSALVTTDDTDTDPLNNTASVNTTVNQITLTYAAGPGGSLTGNVSQLVSYGGDGSPVTAVPNTGYHFVNWTDTSTANPRTDLNVTANISVTAIFAINTYTLSVYKDGTGSGTVTSIPAGIDCGPDCSEVYTHGTIVTLTATPTGSVFFGWTGAGCSDTGTCIVTMDAARSVTATFNTQADLIVTKSDYPDPVFAGEPLTYTITVANNGPSLATSVILTDSLPGGVIFVSANPSQGSCADQGDIVCPLGSLPTGANAEITIVVTSTVSGAIVNNVEVSSAIADSVPGNNSASQSTTVNPAADLAVTKTDDPDPVYAASPFTYLISIENRGPSTANNVVLTDNFPSQFWIESIIPDQGTCNGTTTITCAVGSIPGGNIVQVTIHAYSTITGTFTNQVSVSTSTTDLYPTNNTDSESTRVSDAKTDLSVTASASPNPVTAGENIRYIFHVTNSGPSIANNVFVDNTLSTKTSFLNAETSQGSCIGTDCDLGMLWIGQSETVTITALVAPGATGTILNTVHVVGDEADENTADNTAQTVTTIFTSADLGITQSDAPDPVIAGNNLTYLLTITNNGPSNARDIIVEDTLPAGISGISASLPNCTVNLPSVLCLILNLEVSKSVQITLTGQISSSMTATPLVNQVEVRSSTSDPNLANNNTTASTTLITRADLSVSQTDNRSNPVFPQEIIQYTINLTNLGPSVAQNVTINDTLPSGVTYVSSSPGTPTCTQASGVVHCELGNLVVNQSSVVTVSVQVNKTTYGTITNTVTVLSATTDPYSNNNTSTETTEVYHDTVSPTVTWVLPTTYEQRYDVHGETVTLQVEASDTFGLIDYVRFYRWDAVTLKWIIIYTDYIAPYQYNFNTLVLRPEWNDVRAIAYDTAGNASNFPRIFLFYYPPPYAIYLPIIIR